MNIHKTSKREMLLTFETWPGHLPSWKHFLDSILPITIMSCKVIRLSAQSIKAMLLSERTWHLINIDTALIWQNSVWIQKPCSVLFHYFQYQLTRCVCLFTLKPTMLYEATKSEHSCSVIYSYVEWDLDQWYYNVGRSYPVKLESSIYHVVPD